MPSADNGSSLSLIGEHLCRLELGVAATHAENLLQSLVGVYLYLHRCDAALTTVGPPAPLDRRIAELFCVLLKSDSIAAQYTERFGKVLTVFLQKYFGKLIDVSRPTDEIGVVFGLLLAKEWQKRAARFFEKPDAPFRDEFERYTEAAIANLWATHRRSFTHFRMVMREKVAYPFRPDEPEWQSETVGRLVACSKRYLCYLCRWLAVYGRDFSAWEAKFKLWCDRAEREGPEVASLRHWDRKEFGRGVIPDERPEDRALDLLVAERKVGVIEAFGLSRSELIRRVGGYTAGGSAPWPDASAGEHHDANGIAGDAPIPALPAPAQARIAPTRGLEALAESEGEREIDRRQNGLTEEGDDSDWIITSQAALARGLGLSQHYTGLIEKLKKENRVKEHLEISPNKHRIKMRDPAEHARLKLALTPTPKKKRRSGPKT